MALREVAAGKVKLSIPKTRKKGVNFLTMIHEKRFQGDERGRGTQGTGLIADPIYHYIVMTDRIEGRNRTDVIDTPGSTASTDLPTAECSLGISHSRAHSFSTLPWNLHVAGTFSERLYPLFSRFSNRTSSFPYLDELLRLAGLLHDTGHGPFCHFFDEQYLLDSTRIMRRSVSISSERKFLLC